MLAEALWLEDRFELTSQEPVSEGSYTDFMKLADVRATIGLIRSGVLPELNRTTREIILFDSLHSPQDSHAVFFPFPRFKRNNWEFENDHDGVLSARYTEYLLCLRTVLKERPGDWLTIGSGSIRIPNHSQLAIVSVSAADYFDFEIRKKGPDFKVFVNSQEEFDAAIASSPSRLAIEVIQENPFVRSVNYKLE